MNDNSSASLYDIRQAIAAIYSFTEEISFAEYEQNELIRSAVERKFEIIGEALNRLKREQPELLETIRNYRKIVSFRNILIHAYDSIDNRIVWDVIQNDLDKLLEDVAD